MKKVLIIIGIAFLIISGAYVSENGLPKDTILLVILLTPIPVIHAIIKCPKTLPFYWIWINVFLGILAYPFFLMSLNHAKKKAKVDSV
ncbi:hypothetical protein L4D15_24220 [Enterovibrio norvegicus]|uniref:hypothetical protein n=1 Tax=Enterovibrio norvegicus TaxID=188144 RepID=UPI003D0EC2F6